MGEFPVARKKDGRQGRRRIGETDLEQSDMGNLNGKDQIRNPDPHCEKKRPGIKLIGPLGMSHNVTNQG